MGLRNFLIKKLLRIDPKFLPKLAVANNPTDAVDKYLESQMEENKNTLAFARKLNKANLMKAQTADLLDAVGINKEEEFEEDEEPNTEDKVVSMLLEKFLSGPKAPKQNQIDEFGSSPKSPQADLGSLAKDLLPTLTEEQTKILKDKGIF